MHTEKTYAIKHIRSEVPAFEVPAFAGNSYEQMVPDTLDIQERIALAVNGLTGPTDPDKDYLVYFFAILRTDPPVMQHTTSDICQIKHMESLPLMRLASGSGLNDHIDPFWMKAAMQMIGPDGLAYWPAFPWAPYPCWCEPCAKGESHYAMPFMNGRLIGAMTTYMLLDPTGPWDSEIKKIVDGLRSIAIEKDDYAYFPHGGFAPGAPRLKDAEVPVGILSSLVGWTIQGLAQYHRVSGYEPAKELAGKLARYLVYHGRYFGENGEFLYNDEGNEKFHEKTFYVGPPPVRHYIHFQHHAVPLLGVLDHAIAVGDDELCEFVRKSYEWARSKGNALTGYFPENIDDTGLQTAETCEVAGMIALALKLSAAGIGDYWDDADRWIRNQFAENQLMQADWAYNVAGGELKPCGYSQPGMAVDSMTETADHVPERNIGGFAGWPTANDWYVGHGKGIMMCCTGNGTRALYYIWEHILEYHEGTLSVNLLMNRPSPWADVHSHVPYTGQVDVLVKQDCEQLRVRIPEWVEPEQASCTVNGECRELEWDGRYGLVGPANAGDKVSLTFPIFERKVKVDIEKGNYLLTIRGNDVVDIFPRGRYWPLYQRAHLRQDVTRWKMARRFVAEKDVYW